MLRFAAGLDSHNYVLGTAYRTMCCLVEESYSQPYVILTLAHLWHLSTGGCDKCHKLDLNETAELEKVVGWMSSRTGVNSSEVKMVLEELHEGIIFYGAQGTPVKLPGVGIFTPYIDRDGTFKIGFRADPELKRAINVAGRYEGRMKLEGNIGITNEALKELWDTDHPDDLLEI